MGQLGQIAGQKVPVVGEPAGKALMVAGAAASEVGQAVTGASAGEQFSAGTNHVFEAAQNMAGGALSLWALPNNLIGALAVLFLQPWAKYDPVYAIETPWGRHHALVTWTSLTAGTYGGAVTFGFYIFMMNPPWWVPIDVPKHECGHTVQSLVLGPLFFPTVGFYYFIWKGFVGGQHLDIPIEKSATDIGKALDPKAVRTGPEPIQTGPVDRSSLPIQTGPLRLGR